MSSDKVMPIIRYTVFSAFKSFCLICLFLVWNLSIIGNINYLENKRTWNGVIFNQQHCPIFVINKVELFDSLFYIMPANKLKTVPIRLILSPDFYSIRIVILESLTDYREQFDNG